MLYWNQVSLITKIRAAHSMRLFGDSFIRNFFPREWVYRWKAAKFTMNAEAEYDRAYENGEITAW